MQMTGSQYIAAPCQKVWKALNDPQVLQDSIPGCQSLSKDADDRFSATVEVKVGPISARFRGEVSLTNLNPPHGYTLNLAGNGGIAGTVQGSANVRLSEHNGGTLVAYDVDAQVGGRMMQLGGPIIDATAKQLAGKFFTRFGEMVSGGKAPAVAAAQPAGTAVKPAGYPWPRLLTILLAAAIGFLLGRTPNVGSSELTNLTMGLLLLLVAGAAFDFGRRTAAPVVTLDPGLLRRLLEDEAS